MQAVRIRRVCQPQAPYQHGDGRGLEVSRSCFLQDQLLNRQIRDCSAELIFFRKSLQLRDLRPCHAAKLPASCVIGRVTDLRRSAGLSHIRTPGQIQFHLPQDLQAVLVRMPLSSQLNYPHWHQKNGSTLRGQDILEPLFIQRWLRYDPLQLRVLVFQLP